MIDGPNVAVVSKTKLGVVVAGVCCSFNLRLFGFALLFANAVTETWLKENGFCAWHSDCNGVLAAARL